MEEPAKGPFYPTAEIPMGCHCLVVTDIHWTEINLLFFKKKYRSYLFYSFFLPEFILAKLLFPTFAILR